MKVLVLVHGLPVGGTEMMVCHLARRWREEDTDVVIACLDEVGELGEGLRSEGFEIVELNRQPGFDRALASRLRRTIRQGGFDVVHAHQYTCYFYGAIARIFGGCPLVFTEHGRFYPDLPSRKRRIFNKLLGKKATHITAVSEGVRRALVDIEGFPDRRIETLYNGIDVDRFAKVASRPRAELRREAGLPVDAPVLGTVGRLDGIKNHGFLLQAFARLRQRVPPACLAILGGGPEREHLETLARKLDLGDSVHFLGQRQAAAEVLAAFDAFTLTSLSEGTPMTILEAMACSRPIVATAVGGIPEVLENGQEAILIEGTPPDCRDAVPADAEGYLTKYVEAVEHVLLDADSAGKLATRALERVQSQFSLDVICRRYLEIFEKVTGKQSIPQAARLQE